MNRFYLLLLVVVLCAASSLHAQITLTRNNVVFVPGNYKYNQLLNVLFPRTTGVQQWDLATVTSFDATGTLVYTDSANQDFPGSLTSYLVVPLSNTGTGYTANDVYTMDDAGIKLIGQVIPYQAYSLGALTGNNNDSLAMLKQNAVTQGFRYLIKFPATGGDVWTSTYWFRASGQLTVAAAGLNKTPIAKTSYQTYTDSVIAWGKARIPTSDGKMSDWTDVLCVKRRSVTVDSLWMNGQPAPPLLLAQLGAVQGMRTATHRYVFWRAHIAPFVNVYYAGDSTYAGPATVSFDGSVAASSGVYDQDAKATPGSFPNPSRGETTIAYETKSDGITTIELVNTAGSIVKTIPVYSPAGMLRVPVDLSELANGSYRYIVRSERGTVVANGEVVIAK